jgi:hypothetical protein
MDQDFQKDGLLIKTGDQIFKIKDCKKFGVGWWGGKVGIDLFYG